MTLQVDRYVFLNRGMGYSPFIFFIKLFQKFICNIHEIRI